MKHSSCTLVLVLAALSAAAQETVEEVGPKNIAAVSAASLTAGEVPKPATARDAQGPLPEGVVTETNPLKLAVITKAGSHPAYFRPTQNLPEVVNEDVLRGMSETGKAPGKASNFIGYMPKLKVLPCAKGCEGKDYDRAVAALIRGYRGEGNYFKERGEMVVQVRWFNSRPWYMKSVPYSADVFGVSFILEGKLVSLGKTSGVGTKVAAADLAESIGARLAAELAYSLGMGVRPTFLVPVNKDALHGVATTVMETGAKVDGVLGVEDVRSRIEPVTEASTNLLPAVDGIKPGEIEPISEIRYLSSIMF